MMIYYSTAALKKRGKTEEKINDFMDKAAFMC